MFKFGITTRLHSEMACTKKSQENEVWRRVLLPTAYLQLAAILLLPTCANLGEKKMPENIDGERSMSWAPENSCSRLNVIKTRMCPFFAFF